MLSGSNFTTDVNVPKDRTGCLIFRRVHEFVADAFTQCIFVWLSIAAFVRLLPKNLFLFANGIKIGL
jgi:hypothetical protein